MLWALWEEFSHLKANLLLQTGGGASVTAGTRSQPECCTISHILGALSSRHPRFPWKPRAVCHWQHNKQFSVRGLKATGYAVTWSNQDVCSKRLLTAHSALKNQKCSSISILTSLSGFMHQINPSLGPTPGMLMLSFFLHFLKTLGKSIIFALFSKM